VVLSPDGTISRYFLGVDYPPVELRRALQDAGAGTVGPKAEQIFLYCFHYDPATGRYGLIISRAMQVLGVVTFLALAGLILLNVRRERRRVHLAELGS
jgi:protein SCO1/2